MPSSSASGSEVPASREELGALAALRFKLVWLTVFRVVATSLLLGIIAVRLLSHPVEELSRADSLSFAAIGVVYALTLVYGVVLRRGRVDKSAAYAQVLGDVLLASCLVYLTGGAESPFTFTYSLAVVAASILLFQQGALIAAAASSGAFALLVVLIQTGVLHPPMESSTISSPRLVFVLVSNVLAQLLIAALASYLARQLSAAGGRLSEREEDLAKLASIQRQILSAMPSGLITCEADGTISFINRAATAILGLPADGDRTITLDELLPGALRLAPAARRTELSVQTANGQRSLGLTVTPLEGRAGSLLIVFQDLTDLRRMEDQLRRSDQLAALGALAAQLAHEIRNPLAAMRGSAQMLSQEAGAGTLGARLTGILVREADRLAGLVDEFLRFARPPPPQLRACSLRELILETVEMLRGDPLASGVQISADLDDISAPVDAGQIRQVLINLLRNAFAAVKHRGEVRVTLRADGGRPYLKVWDSAGSISPAHLERIFEPFFTTREGGTGLGLSTAHSIIRSHGGMIQVSSSPSAGTEFVVGLPHPSEVAVADPGR